jgi:uncharacterized protein involved in exopolysaccharide biosynthesis
MNEQNYVADDEISLLDIYEFFRRHFITLCVVFVACFGSVAAYLVSQPTIYKTTVQLTIGKDAFFLTPSTNLIESAEQTKHRFGSTVRIDAVKNTGILNIVAERTTSENSLNDALTVANQIVADHKALREQKVEQFKMLLSATSPSQSELMRVVDAASSSTPTRITNEPQTVALPYKGLLYKGLGIGIFAAAFIALLFALALDAKAKIKLARQQP